MIKNLFSQKIVSEQIMCLHQSHYESFEDINIEGLSSLVSGNLSLVIIQKTHQTRKKPPALKEALNVPLSVPGSRQKCFM